MTSEPDETPNEGEQHLPPRPAGAVTLRSLAPKYLPTQHSGYVRHLEDAIKDPKNKNIALTGRYGSGKSSVLDEFETKHKADTLRISINTLGPDGEDEGLTNRIQKELVKQLVYRARPGKLRRSRFARVAPLTKSRAFFEALAFTALVSGLLWLLGVRPEVTGLSSDHDWEIRWLSGVGFAVLVVLAVWLVRWLIGDRIISQVKTAGTTVTLEAGPDTYFDKYLDEIVAFFDAVSPKFVILEDLDRFDDPLIFDSLRELNTLINASAHWKGNEQPLRFIYAIKDSLFEQLGAEPEPRNKRAETTDVTGDADAGPPPGTDAAPSLDPAVAAVERANRTKFFELVIPVVPFISHRNARDLLVQALKDLGLSEDIIRRPLLDLVARHATDMRLLLNVCNEFAVFSEKLLWVETPAPGMTADDLFALVAYKNFHLADFEAVPQRVSSLDTLEEHHRKLVRSCIADRERQKRDLIRSGATARSREKTAQKLGAQLLSFAEAVRFNQSNRALAFNVGSTEYDADKVQGGDFWEHLATEGSLTVSAVQRQYTPTELARFARKNLLSLFPDGMSAGQWQKLDEAGYAQKLRAFDADIAFLRGARFEALAKRPEFTHDGKTFDKLIDETLKSGLARDLVRRGFINRNYAEYSATFYGNFVGVDVAFFYNHSVQPNQMYLDYEFQNPQSIPNLLEQAPADFTSSVSVYNLQVVSYLLRENIDAARKVVGFLVSDFSVDARTFLDAFVNNSAAPRDELIELLSANPWGGVFDYLANHEGIPDDATRLKLLDAALRTARPVEKYDLNEGTDELLAQNYAKLSAFTQEQPPGRSENTFDFAQRAELVVTDLSVLSSRLRELIVDKHLYDLSTENLRVALGIEGAVTLDEVRKNVSVWEYCRENIDDFLEAVRNDEATEHTVQSAKVLGEVLVEQHETWTGGELGEILVLSAPGSALPTLESVPPETWPGIVDAARVQPSVANLTRYTDANGVDQHLAAFLVPSTDHPLEVQVDEDVDGEEERVALATRLLNASSSIPSTGARVHLAASLNLPTGAIAATALTVNGDDLLALALKADLVPDTEESFQHFVAAGWRSVEKAFAVSKNIGTFLSPDLVFGVVAELLSSSQVPDEIRTKVLDDLDKFVADGDQAALRAAGKLAQQKRVKLPIAEVRRIAQATQDPDLVLWQLVSASSTSPDELIETLALLGAPYTGLNGGPGHEFDLPSGSSNQTLLSRLEEAGRVQIVKKALRGRKVRIVTDT